MSKPEKLNLATMRVDYSPVAFDETSVDKNPMKQFEIWMHEAIESGVNEPNAMTLATVSINGKPNARIVLLKEFDTAGFIFYTNYESTKGIEISENPNAALVFFWKEQARQIRIVGNVEKISRVESEKYFHSRPRESQLGAVASKQSSKIEKRSLLESKFQELQIAFDGKEIPLPENWGGYRVVPFEMEFWQGRESRLHDRILYKLVNGEWQISRLSP